LEKLFVLSKPLSSFIVIGDCRNTVSIPLEDMLEWYLPYKKFRTKGKLEKYCFNATVRST
jgi:hypothetical protein